MNTMTNYCFFKNHKISVVKQKEAFGGPIFYSKEFNKNFYTLKELFNFMNGQGYFHLTQNTLNYIYE